jgi:hypothetical protein
MKPTALLLLALVLLALALLAAACGDADGGTSTVPPTSVNTTSTTDVTPVTPPPFCEYYDMEGCALYGLVLPSPLAVDDALVAAGYLPGVPIAVWRTGFVCIPQVNTGPPGEEVLLEPSRFAYVDAEGIRERRLQASGTVAPPITGLHISQSYWDRWEDQWAQVHEPGTLVEAVAVYLPREVVADGPPAGFRALVRLEWRRTDTLDPAVYPGELLLESEEFPAGYLSEAEAIACG